jgi:hypothetical protein
LDLLRQHQHQTRPHRRKVQHCRHHHHGVPQRREWLQRPLRLRSQQRRRCLLRVLRRRRLCRIFQHLEALLPAC